MPDLTFAEVGQILRLLESIDASEVDLEWGDLRLRVRHGDASVSDGAAASPKAAITHASPEPGASVIEPEAPTATERQAKAPVDSRADIPHHWVAIKAPMVGTFYRSPKPGEPAFVDAGDVVALGDTVGLVEVMKLFTELKTEVAGKVARIDADDTALVEFGQPLIWIEPA
jgi:acetyl-CoA carboxylase biotin carboxyl carrier protein